jgi:hypothetical protein
MLNLRICGEYKIVGNVSVLYRIALTKSAIFPVPFLVKSWIKALPMIAPWRIVSLD